MARSSSSRSTSSKSSSSSAVGRGLLLAAIAAAFVWFWDSVWVWPLKLIVVVFHELSHAAAAVLTGGEVVSIGLSANEGGITVSRGGIRWVILNAGYLGSLLWGVGLLYAARSPERARTTATLLGVLLAFVSLWYMRPFFSFGTLFAGFVVLGMLAVGRLASAVAASFLLQALGVFSVLYALADIRSDVLHLGRSGTTDATMLADLTGVPAMVWGAGWLVAGVAILALLRRWIV